MVGRLGGWRELKGVWWGLEVRMKGVVLDSGLKEKGFEECVGGCL